MFIGRIVKQTEPGEENHDGLRDITPNSPREGRLNPTHEDGYCFISNQTPPDSLF
jgi:hypothetical protein